MREAVDAGGGEGHPVVGANGPRQPILVKEAIENAADAPPFRREQAATAEEVVRVLVGDRQRIAIDAIAGPEVALEICGPEIIRLFVVGGTTPGCV